MQKCLIFQQLKRRHLACCIYLGENNNFIKWIIKWWLFEPTLHQGKLQKFSDQNMENGQKDILNNADYLCKQLNAKLLSGNISEVILNVTINDANAVAICPCVAELPYLES